MAVPSQDPKFEPGETVRIRNAYPIGHCRTPFYIRGLSGKVERICGHFPNPEELAYGRDSQPALPLYRVRICMTEIWSDYSGPSQDTVEVEVFEHWLEHVGHPNP